MADPKALTRNQIAAFVGTDPEAIRAIERLFRVAGELTPSEIEALLVSQGVAQNQVEAITGAIGDLAQKVIQADTATALTQSALAQLVRISDVVQGLALAPPILPLPRKAYGTFYDTNTQNAAVINTAYTVSFSNTDLSFGVYLAAGAPATRITVDQAGLYDFQHSIQIDKTTGGKGLFYLWYRKNGTDVAESATRLRVEGNNSENVAAWNYVFKLKAGDYIEYRWAVDDLGVEIKRFAAAAPVPAIPSVIVTVTNNIGD
jgi:hypothetical protein